MNQSSSSRDSSRDWTQNQNRTKRENRQRKNPVSSNEMPCFCAHNTLLLWSAASQALPSFFLELRDAARVGTYCERPEVPR